MPRRAARVDDAQAEIVRVLTQCGASVESLAAQGNGVPDLLVGVANRNYLLEVKAPRRGRTTPCQDDWHQRWRGQATIVRTPDEALRAVGLIR